MSDFQLKNHRPPFFPRIRRIQDHLAEPGLRRPAPLAGARLSAMYNLAALASLGAVLLFLLPGCQRNPENRATTYSFVVVRTSPHDPSAFTEGLVWDRGDAYEGTGKLGRSSVRRVDPDSGKVLQRHDCAPEIYGEGITVLGDRLYQLTWKNHLVFVYDRQDLSLIETVDYPRQGWGITHNGTALIASDGTSSLYFLDPGTLTELHKVTVRDDGRQIRDLNELEYIKGRVWANVYRSNRIAIINPADGSVDGWIDLSGLSDRLRLHDKDAVLNGIMYDSKDKRLFVTGKFWPVLFEIRILTDRPAKGKMKKWAPF